ncbi:MAG: PocR ligand-binding domain-containing protein [Oscillospiraceae bacterium]|nr:PocR ligand-binding domain-containing protein [Oscillospiraceae bacterium]
MAQSIFSLVPKERLQEILGSLQEFTGISIQLIDRRGSLLLSFGKTTGYCARLKQQVFSADECLQLHVKAGERAQALGEAYIFSCHANLNHIACPLISRGELLGSVILGPFLMDQPDSTLISELADRYRLEPTLCLELYDELSSLQVLEPQKVNHLQRLLDQLLSSLLPGERALLLQTRQKVYQQSRIGETIRIFKEQESAADLRFLYEKEKNLLTRLRSGSQQESEALLNELIGQVILCSGGKLDTVRTRAMELTTQLSRAAMEGGARTDSIYSLNEAFLRRLQAEQDLDELCMTVQEALESYRSAMFFETDKGNPYIRRALRYMADHYSRHLELNQVAAVAGLSPSYFSTLFREVVGVSFREHLCRIRVEESKRLLLSTDYSLADIAVAMGFPDQSYYCKVFKKLVGLTPGKYRT